MTPYSYFDADPEIEELMRTGAYMERATFEHYRNKALPYYRNWVNHVTWEQVRTADRLMRQHAFLGCTTVLNLSGTGGDRRAVPVPADPPGGDPGGRRRRVSTPAPNRPLPAAVIARASRRSPSPRSRPPWNRSPD